MFPPLARSAATAVAGLILAVALASPAEAKRRGRGHQADPLAVVGAALGSLVTLRPAPRRAAAPRRASRPARVAPGIAAADPAVPVPAAPAPPPRQALLDPPMPAAGRAVASAPSGGGWVDPIR